MQVLLDVKGQDGVTRMFTEFEHRAMNTKVVLAEVAELIAKGNEATYGRGAALSDQTIETKARKGLPSEKLVATGRMREQLTSEHGIRLLTDTELIFGVDESAWYARFAQYGTLHEPKRRVLKFGTKIRVATKDMLLRHLMGRA